MATKSKPATPSTPAAPAQPAPAKSVPGTIKVLKENAQFRGARQAWYDVLRAHNGKPLADYVTVCTATPPSLPKSGRAESPSGWVRYFVRTGVLAIQLPSSK